MAAREGRRTLSLALLRPDAGLILGTFLVAFVFSYGDDALPMSMPSRPFSGRSAP